MLCRVISEKNPEAGPLPDTATAVVVNVCEDIRSDPSAPRRAF